LVGVQIPGPTQSTEAVTLKADNGGLWSIDVGAQENGCATGPMASGSFTYTNGQPVAYKLDLTIA
jgi:hypothetical protein